MPLKGNFETLELTSILQLLCNEIKTGELHISKGNDQASIYFKEGSIIYGTDNRKENRLGCLLKNKGVISENQLTKCLDAASEQNVSIGKILVDKGYISFEKLESFIHQQTEEIIIRLFLWGNADFEYEDSKINTSRFIATRLNVMKLIMDASRRIDEMNVLVKQITSEDLIFKITAQSNDRKEIKLNTNELHILTLIDGRRTVRDVIKSSNYDKYAVYKILYSFLSSGLIKKDEPSLSE